MERMDQIVVRKFNDNPHDMREGIRGLIDLKQIVYDSVDEWAESNIDGTELDNHQVEMMFEFAESLLVDICNREYGELVK